MLLNQIYLVREYSILLNKIWGRYYDGKTTWAVSLGVTTHVNPLPRVTGSEAVTKLLTEDIENLFGGKIVFNRAIRCPDEC
jgi:hypothetical protein